MKKLGLLMMVLVMVVAILTLGCAPKEGAKIQWRAHSSDTIGEPSYDFVAKVAQEITINSGGRLVVTPYAGGALGYEGADLLRVFSQNGLEMAQTSMAHHAGEEPISDVFKVPFLTADPADGPILAEGLTPMWNELFAKWNVQVLTAGGIPHNTLSAPRKVDTIEGWEGLKIRTFNPTISAIVELMGATGVPIPYAEAYSATATGIINGHLWSPGGVYDGRIYELLSHVNLWSIAIGIDSFVVNKTALEALPSDLQEIVWQAVDKWDDWWWDEAYWTAQDDLQNLRDIGMIVVDVPASEKTRAAERLAPVWDEWLERAGPDGLKWLNFTLGLIGKPAYK